MRNFSSVSKINSLNNLQIVVKISKDASRIAWIYINYGRKQFQDI